MPMHGGLRSRVRQRGRGGLAGRSGKRGERRTMEITRGGTRPSGSGSGRLLHRPGAAGSGGRRAGAGAGAGGLVTFEPGARTAWHTHPLGQTLRGHAGLRALPGWGGPVEEIRPGDTVWIPPGEKHWHGAAPQVALVAPRDPRGARRQARRLARAGVGRGLRRERCLGLSRSSRLGIAPTVGRDALPEATGKERDPRFATFPGDGWKSSGAGLPVPAHAKPEPARLGGIATATRRAAAFPFRSNV